MTRAELDFEPLSDAAIVWVALQHRRLDEDRTELAMPDDEGGA